MSTPTVFYNRATGQLQEELILGDKLLRLAYTSCARHFLAWPLFGNALFSKLMGKYADSTLSRSRVDKTIADLKMDMGDYMVPQGGFPTFNDFFTRHLKPGARPFPKEGLCSPADCRLTVWPELKENTCIPVKGAQFTISQLLGDDEYAKEFINGSLCVFRLCPSDYHRYHFPDDGRILKFWRMPGRFHSVHPLALAQNIKVFTTNVREISMLELKHFGLCAFIEVGAFGVARITQTHQGQSFMRGHEKGFFSFGGSTIITVFKQNAVVFHEDIRKQSASGIECLIKAGEHIGK